MSLTPEQIAYGRRSIVEALELAYRMEREAPRDRSGEQMRAYASQLRRFAAEWTGVLDVLERKPLVIPVPRCLLHDQDHVQQTDPMDPRYWVLACPGCLLEGNWPGEK